jgi:hypothetical protein
LLTGFKLQSVESIKRTQFQEGVECTCQARIVKVLEHSDRLEEDANHGLVARYYHTARALRRHGAFGEGQKTMRAVAKHRNESWARPVGIQVQGTRTPLFEVYQRTPTMIVIAHSLPMFAEHYCACRQLPHGFL